MNNFLIYVGFLWCTFGPPNYMPNAPILSLCHFLHWSHFSQEMIFDLSSSRLEKRFLNVERKKSCTWTGNKFDTRRGQAHNFVKISLFNKNPLRGHLSLPIGQVKNFCTVLVVVHPEQNLIIHSYPLFPQFLCFSSLSSCSFAYRPLEYICTIKQQQIQ